MREGGFAPVSLFTGRREKAILSIWAWDILSNRRSIDFTMIDFLVFAFWGILIGFLAGLFGVGGGGLIVPLLVFSYGHLGVSPSVSTHIAIATSLFVVFFASLASAYQQRKQHNIHWHASIVLGLSSALTAMAAVRLAIFLSGKQLRIAFALIIVMLAVKIFSESALQDEKRHEPPSHLNLIHLAVIGFAAGVISALAGVGGGGITITLMYYFLKMPIKLAIGTSSAAMVITALFGVSGYIVNGIGHIDLPDWSFGFIDFQRGIALAAGTLLTARIGAYVSFRAHPYYLRKFFALFLIFISIYISFVK